MPTESTLKQSLEELLVNGKKGSDHVDLCCRWFLKCNAFKRFALEIINKSYNNHCECLYSFQNCLKDLNSTLSNEIGLLHSMDVTKCYSKDHPINKCAAIENYIQIINGSTFFEAMNRTEHFNRCLKYDLNRNQPKTLQLFDAPFYKNGNFSSNSNGKHGEVKYVNIEFS